MKNLHIERIEPPCWWVGMNTPLQLILYGKDLVGSKVHIHADGVKVRHIHRADSPNYLFVDIEINPETEPGEYLVEIKKGRLSATFTYQLYKRRRGSANRKSFSPVDLIYLIIPDRFANGDSSNDSTEDTLERANRKEPFGRHGGDLQGIINHLDYLCDLGVTTLWLTPPQLDNESKESYHGYACADYYRIDPRFGDNELYKQMIKEAHKRDLKVIMDAVPNHCGTQHWWMKDLPFKDWVHLPAEFIRSNYRLSTISDPNSSEYNRLHTIYGWFDDNMPDLAIEQPYVLRYFLQLYIWWVEWADLDGLRVDTYPYNDKHSIAEWTRRTLEEYPNLNIVAECWNSSPAVVAYWYGSTPNQDGYCSYLPSVMDFPLQEALVEGLEKDSKEWTEGMNRIFEALSQDFLYNDPKNLLIFLDNHDMKRFADCMKGNVNKIKIGLTLLATLRGIPQLYYGTEYGFQSSGPAEEHGNARKDFPGGWKGDRKNLFTGHNINKKEAEIFEHAKKLFVWRKNKKVIHNGATTHFLPQENVYVYFRYIPGECVMVILNPSGKDVKVDWKQYAERLTGYKEGVNILNGKKVKIGKTYVIKSHQSAVIELY